ncbi:MAG TPA: DNA polymerase III subunit gamma/tau [Candidatus Kapabacteria bacterium]|nr:DNA polymerase III subunit gamma/tau [Candidatus Kapabacteria bacterium]HPO61932.1 DNA polymerase III subunit gamma/tau [Candidatus Kapabacteria bacterium]
MEEKEVNNLEKKSNYVVSARKFRPMTFSELVGQQHISTTLKNAIKSSRIHHAYLFSGPRGVGKTTTARILARAVNCPDSVDFEPCNKCQSCLSVINGNSLDIIEIDGASNNSVDDVRKLRENAIYTPVYGKYKMYIIDEVHMLSTSAFNALLKTLEEPPPHLLFVFATTEQHKVPATILSRCQRFEFYRIKIEDIAKQLRYIADKEIITVDDASLLTIAKKADGSMRDGQSIFDQAVAFCGTNIKYSNLIDALHLIDQDFFFLIDEAIYNKDVEKVLNIANDVVTKGHDLQECLNGMLEHYRNLITCKATGDGTFIETSKEYMDRYLTDHQKYSNLDLLRIMHIISSAETSLKFSAQPKIRFEMCLLDLANLDSSVDISELLNSIKDGANIEQMPRVQTPAPAPRPEPNHIIVQTPAPQIVKEPTFEKETPKKFELVEEKQVEKKPLAKSKNIEENWEQFIRDCGNSSTGLQILQHSSSIFPKFFEKEIIFYVEDDFIKDNLLKNKQKLLDALEEFYGFKILVKILNQIPDDFEKKKVEYNFSQKEEEIKLDEELIKDKHPVEIEILKFGAKEMSS